jgi:hypothetical protein
MIPLHLSGAVIACIFALLACVAVVLVWAMCVVVDEWGRDGFDGEVKGKGEDWE